MRRVVVGVGGSPVPGPSLALAVDEALRRRLPLDVVHAVPCAVGYGGRARPPVVPGDVEAQVRRAVEGILGTGQVQTRVHVVDGRPTEALRPLADGAALVVVGRGPETQEVLRRTWAPVMVVPRDVRRVADRGRQSRVLVGVDGSPASLSALAWATAQAAQWGSELVQMTARGRVVEALISAPGPEDLLVLGSRGQTGVPSLVLGGTSARVVEACPSVVVVVREGQARRETHRSVVRPGSGPKTRSDVTFHSAHGQLRRVD